MALDVPRMGSKPELPDYLAEQAGRGTNALACLGHFFRGGERHGGQFGHLRGIVGNLLLVVDCSPAAVAVPSARDSV